MGEYSVYDKKGSEESREGGETDICKTGTNRRVHARPTYVQTVTMQDSI